MLVLFLTAPPTPPTPEPQVAPRGPSLHHSGPLRVSRAAGPHAAASAVTAQVPGETQPTSPNRWWVGFFGHFEPPIKYLSVCAKTLGGWYNSKTIADVAQEYANVHAMLYCLKGLQSSLDHNPSIKTS